MPYAKRYRRRRTRRKPITYRQIGRKVWRDVRRIKRFFNVEFKYLDTINSAQAMSSSGTLVLLNGLQQGTSGITRNGQSVKFVSITMKGFIAINASATRTDTKVALFVDRQANQGTPSSSNIWTSNDPTALRLIGTGKRFSIKMDRQYALSIAGRECVHFELFKKMSLHTRYNTASVGDATDITTNSFWLYYSSSEATNTPTITYSVRLRYVDN